MSRIFESSLEKIGRIIAGQYGINVVFEGNQAATDGKTIFLPSTADLTPELMADMHGFLDHEVSHCRYTDFYIDGISLFERVINGRGGRFHKELMNALEDGRIERLMIDEYPGCRFNLEPLNTKLRGKLKTSWEKLPWPVKLICTIRDVMDGEKDAMVEDPEIKPFLAILEAEIAEINGCKSTEDILELTRIMTTKILDKLDEQAEEDAAKHGKGDLKEGGKGSGESPESSESKGKGKESSGRGKSGSAASKGGKAEKGENDDGAEGDKMITERGISEAATDKPSISEWNEHDLSVDDMVRRDLKAHFGEDVAGTERPAAAPRPVRADEKAYGGVADTDRSRSTVAHIAYSTRFDKLRDFSGAGNAERYKSLRAKVQPYISAIKRQLERKLKVDAHTKHQGDRERGMINSRALANMITDRNFKRPFKEITKKQTNNVAVQILIDQSGSMHGPKLEMAKMSAIAMGEALTELHINFEVTGFYSIGDSNLIKANPTDKRFNRRQERLEKHVFKSFGTNNMTGIERVESGAQNPDGEAVRWAADRLMMQKEKRKILIVMSDGQPCTGEGNPQILRGDLHGAVRKLMKAGVEVIGFGIQDQAVKEFYPDHLVIERLEDLPVKTMVKLGSLLGG